MRIERSFKCTVSKSGTMQEEDGVAFPYNQNHLGNRDAHHLTTVSSRKESRRRQRIVIEQGMEREGRR